MQFNRGLYSKNFNRVFSLEVVVTIIFILLGRFMQWSHGKLDGSASWWYQTGNLFFGYQCAKTICTRIKTLCFKIDKNCFCFNARKRSKVGQNIFLEKLQRDLIVIFLRINVFTQKTQKQFYPLWNFPCIEHSNHESSAKTIPRKSGNHI